MNPLYQRLSATGYDLISKYGQIVKITHVDQSIDPVNGDQYNHAIKTGDFKAINPPASSGISGSFDNGIVSEAANIYKKIRFLIISAHNATFEPEAGDTVEMDEEEYTIWGCTPVAPDGIKLVYRIGMGV